MKSTSFAIFLLLTCVLCFRAPLSAQVNPPRLIGYWHNWNDGNAPYIPLDMTDQRYDVVIVAFAIPAFGTDYKMSFQPDQGSASLFQSQVQALQAQGRQVLISIGGATAPISLDNAMERDTFVGTMLQIINTYGFDGMDIDLEGSSLMLTGGSITAPVDVPVLNLISAVQEIMASYRAQHQKKMYLTSAPETAYVQGGMSAFGGIWGAYLPLLHALRDSLDVVQVQLYNSGTMFGIDQQIYTQGTADFIVAMSEALVAGFQTSGGFFSGLPAHKIAVGLPACTLAAGGGYTDTASVRAAIDYLRGEGPKPGSYTLSLAGGYPEINKMMTWSINWDAALSCGGNYSFAENFERIFPDSLTTGNSSLEITGMQLYPNPASNFLFIDDPGKTSENITYHLYDITGRLMENGTLSGSSLVLDISQLSKGYYLLQLKGKDLSTQSCFIKQD